MLKNKKTEHCNQKDFTHLLLSAAAAGLIGATTAHLLTRKSSKSGGLYETYENLSEKVGEMQDDIVEKGQKAFSMASDCAESIKDNTAKLIGCLENNGNVPLMLGAVGAGLLGATSIFLLSRKNHPLESHQRAAKSAMQSARSINWLEVAKQFTDILNGKQLDESENVEELAEKTHSHTIQDAIELAASGLRLWQNIKNRR